MIKLPAFFGVETLAVFQAGFLRVVENQVGNSKFFRQLAGFPDGAVVLLVWLETSGIAIETEGLMEQPVAL